MPENSWNITVNKEACDKQHPYAMINIDAMQKACKDLGAGSGFILWTILAKNQNYYTFDISKKELENDFGMKKDKFYKARDTLLAKGYLVDRGKDRYTFYEVPLAEKPTMNFTVGKAANVPLAGNPPKIGEQTGGKTANEDAAESSFGGKTSKESLPQTVPLADFQTVLSEKPTSLSEKPYRNNTDNTNNTFESVVFDDLPEISSSDIEHMFEEGTYKIEGGICYRNDGRAYRVKWSF